MTDTRAAIVDGLRALADAIAADVRIPLGQYAATQGLDLSIHVAAPYEVLKAADAGTGQVTERGHLKTRLDFGPVHLDVVYVDPDYLARYRAEQSYGPNIAAGLVNA